MSLRTFTLAAAMMAVALPAAAQERGTVEFGAFGSAGTFNKSLTLDHGVGVGGHVGVYLDPRWAIEFENAEMRASRTLGLQDVNVGMLTARLVTTPLQSGAFSLMLGAGAAQGTETNFLHSYGVNALVGMKIALSNYAAIRIDALSDWLANYDWKSNQRLQAGLSFYRSPTVRTRTVEVAAAPVPYVQKADSVSAEEQARRRQIASDYRNLRDSLSRPKVVAVAVPSSAAALATMEEKIHFATDKSELSPESKAVLDAKVAIFRSNPAMRIVIVGNTDERASDAYNMGLGERRSSAAKAYLVNQGIDPVRIEITSNGERTPTAAGTSAGAQAQNRRAEFRLLMASDYLVPPKP